MVFRYISSLIIMFLVAACIPSIAPPSNNKAETIISTSPAPIITFKSETKEDRGTDNTAAVTSATYTPIGIFIPNPKGSPAELSTVAGVSASSTPTSYAYLPIVTYTPVPTSGAGIFADHSVIAQFSQIPQGSIYAAAGKKTLFMHQSTGGLIDDSGLGCLAGIHGDPTVGYPLECVTYMANRTANVWPWYDKSKWSWDMWPMPQADAIAKTDQFVDVVHARASNYEVIGMKYCYVDGWNQSTNVEQSYYINKMLALETEYPHKTFIWSTSALWSEPGDSCSNFLNTCRQIAEFNQQIRAYAKAHNKPLYDIADIESHDQNGNPCIVQGYEGMCTVWYGGGGGHPNIVGAIRLAKGFWWLMAKVSGWDGATSATQ